MKNMLLEAGALSGNTIKTVDATKCDENPLQEELRDILTKSGIEDQTVTQLIVGGIRSWDEFLDENISVGKLVSMGITSKQRECLIEIYLEGPSDIQEKPVLHATRRPSRETHIGVKTSVARIRPDKKKKSPWRRVAIKDSQVAV